jgi:hypothetical protein
MKIDSCFFFYKECVHLYFKRFINNIYLHPPIYSMYKYTVHGLACAFIATSHAIISKFHLL